MFPSIAFAIGGGVAGVLTGLALDFTWWELLIIVIAYAIVQLIVQVIIYFLKNKGVITQEQAKDIEEKAHNVLPDLLDDGKLNNSTRRKNKEKDHE